MNKEYAYGIAGILLGIIASLLFTIVISPKNNLNSQGQAVGANTHVMPDGTVMSNSHSSMTMEDMVNVLVNKSGDEFDEAFLEGMIEHHVGAVDMSELVSNQTKHKELKDFAKEIIDAQTKEIEMMKKWQKEWGYED